VEVDVARAGHHNKVVRFGFTAGRPGGITGDEDGGERGQLGQGRRVGGFGCGGSERRGNGGNGGGGGGDDFRSGDWKLGVSWKL
jgi:hypothetical protein